MTSGGSSVPVCLAMMLVPGMRCWLRWSPRCGRNWPGSQAALARAVEELAAARERIAELEARLRPTPRNSSRPPSSQGLDKPPPRGRCARNPAASQAGRTGMKAARWCRWPGQTGSCATSPAAAAGAGWPAAASPVARLRRWPTAWSPRGGPGRGIRPCSTWVRAGARPCARPAAPVRSGQAARALRCAAGPGCRPCPTPPPAPPAPPVRNRASRDRTGRDGVACSPSFTAGAHRAGGSDPGPRHVGPDGLAAAAGRPHDPDRALVAARSLVADGLAEMAADGTLYLASRVASVTPTGIGHFGVDRL